MNIKYISIYLEEFLKVSFIQIWRYGTTSGNCSSMDRSPKKDKCYKGQGRLSWFLKSVTVKHLPKCILQRYTVLQCQSEIFYFKKKKNKQTVILQEKKKKGFDGIGDLFLIKKKKKLSSHKNVRGDCFGIWPYHITKEKVRDTTCEI